MRRVQRANDKEEVIKRLTVGEKPYFKEIWRLILFAAMVGHRHGRREKLGAYDSGKGIDAAIFGNSQPAWPGVLFLMALVETNSHTILQSGEDQDNEKIAIFEEYANGGLSLLRERLDAASYSLDGLLDLILAEGTEVAAPVTVADVEI
jgi:dnd system-associated protein 4